jgi:hypothetical protein
MSSHKSKKKQSVGFQFKEHTGWSNAQICDALQKATEYWLIAHPKEELLYEEATLFSQIKAVDTLLKSHKPRSNEL